MFVGFYLVIFNFFFSQTVSIPGFFFSLLFFSLSLSNRNLQGKFYSCVSLAS